MKRDRQNLRDAWLTMTIKRKIGGFAVFVTFVMVISVCFDLWLFFLVTNDLGGILQDNLKISDYMGAMEQESNVFSEYMKTFSEEEKDLLKEACRKTEAAVNALPFRYSSMSPSRYAKTWSIKNSYSVYVQARDRVLSMNEESPNFIKRLYEVYEMQEYLQEYARELIRYTLEDETISYRAELPFLSRFPLVVMVIVYLLLWGVIHISRLLYQAIVSPIGKLVAVSKRIASNDFFAEDVVVENQDEMGDLVKAFNKMKYATGEYILALEEKRKTLDLLHKEELDHLEAEKRLESTKLELLKSQIDPHFLFNTLNVIGGMANLEDAETTEKMIKALSSLFRYNLKTPQAAVVLTQELRILNDYMYLQQMRFGERLQYHVDCQVDAGTVMVPTFSFQPLVENSIIHGISLKEEGGAVNIRIWQDDRMVIIEISDTGVGMSEEKLEQIRQAVQNGADGRIGIGLGNIDQRIRGMYQDGSVEIFSKEGEGTMVRLRIPQKL